MPEYTINVVYEMQYAVSLRDADRIPDLDLDDNGNGQITVNLADAAAFNYYVYEICQGFRDAYDMTHNKDMEAIKEGLREEYGINLERSSDDEDDADNEDDAEFDFSVYQHYTYSQIEYEINGQEATITLGDTITENESASSGEILETDEQTRIREQYERERREQRERDLQDLLEESDNLVVRQRPRAQFFDTLVPNGIVPRVVALGTVFSLEDFRNLGPFRIERKLFYDDFDVDAEKVDCDIVTPANRKYPIMTIPQNNVYCVTELLQWVVTYNKNTDPLTNGIIERVRIMNESDIENKELEKYTREKALLQKERAEKNAKGTDRRDVRKLDYRIRELQRMILERKAEKIRRKTLNRLLELKF